MRLAGQAKQGFYPCPPDVIALILRHLVPSPVRNKMSILDPCAGEAHAVIQLADGLGVPHENVFAIELNFARSKVIADAYPDIHLLGPASFESTRIGYRGFSLIYLNPPFDTEFGGGQREEVKFVNRAAPLLVDGGVMVLICPLDQLMGKEAMCQAIDTWLEQVEIYVFPAALRKFGECVVIGKRRARPLPPKEIYNGCLMSRRIVRRALWGDEDPLWDKLAAIGETQWAAWDYGEPHTKDGRRETIDMWQLPVVARQPANFVKLALTEEEIAMALEQSPLYRVLETRLTSFAKRPPLPLSRGHTSLLLLSGLLDGYVPSDPPHVVRGHCAKRWGKSRVENYETPGGTQVTKIRTLQAPHPIVRAAWPDGTIVTYEQAAPPEDTKVEIDIDGQAIEEDE